MRVAHFDCFSGIAGDMTLAALLDLGVPPDSVLAGIASLDLPIKMTINKVKRGGFTATQILVDTPQQKKHRHLREIEEILSRGTLTPAQRELALKIFRRLAQAEATVHGVSVEKVHFHEVGALDSIADIAGSAIALDRLGAEKFTSGPVAVGSGTVKCEHGVMPVPPPATAELLKGVPLRPAPVKTELTTPTGAAILTSIVTEYIDTPTLTIEKIGHGAGSKDFPEQPNLLRIFVGQAGGRAALGCESDEIWVLETNLDDVPGEVVGYCSELLFGAGALDVFTTPIQMKKNRPGVMLSVLASEPNLEALEAIMFRETATLGIRRHLVKRSKLRRQILTVETTCGPVRVKQGLRNGETVIFTPEYEDCARLAREHGIALREVFEAARKKCAELLS
jgi:uncharacterized protein (TIGR00299 family) protein